MGYLHRSEKGNKINWNEYSGGTRRLYLAGRAQIAKQKDSISMRRLAAADVLLRANQNA